MSTSRTAQSGSAARHNLPAPRSSFIGREQEMLEIKRELKKTRLITLTGVGGSGKTRLALEVARDLVEGYPDGVWLVELAPLSEEELLPQAVAEVLEVPERPGEPLTDTVAEVLRDREMLLILDNCEHLMEAVAHLVDALLDSCPRLRLLATSRESLGVEGELRWPVPLLSTLDPERSPTTEELERSESARLFVARARNRDPSFALTPAIAQSVAEVCSKLDGIPLAIELAAARVNTLSLEQISERLAHSLELLTRGGRTVAPRQRTLKGALDWSHELLSEPERTLFGRLSVFAGGWTLEAVEAVASAEGIQQSEVMDLLLGLLEKSLAIAEPTVEGGVRYRLLEPIRQYALEKLEQSGESEATKRAHAQYFLALAEEAEPELIGPQEAQWLEQLEEEFDNIRATLSWALEKGELELGLTLAGALRWFWFWQGYYGEGRRWLEGALAEEGGASATARLKALRAVSWLTFYPGDLDRTEAASEEGLRVSAESGIGGGRDVAFFMMMLGWVSLWRGDPEQATKLSEESLTLSRQADDVQGLAWSLVSLAFALGERGDFERAKEFYEESLTLSRQLDSTRLLSTVLIHWGWTSLLEGDYRRATALSSEAVKRYRECGQTGGLFTVALDNLGWAALVQGNLEGAKDLHEESLRVCKERGDKHIASESLEGLACAAAANEEAERAARLFGAAQALRESIGHQHIAEENTLREPYLANASSLLDEETWQEALAEGRAMSMEAAIEYALLEERPSKASSSALEYPAGLTSREVEVLKLVASGMTSAQVANELFLSRRTVDTHLTSIYRKIGVSSRAAAARFATEHGLA